jgi:3-oxoacyl-[acyl-carrier-protein] synthase II
MRRRAVITGIGCVTPLGRELDTVWNALIEGESGVAPITLFDASNFPVRIAAEVKNWEPSDIDETPAQFQRQSRQAQFAFGAAVAACKAAGLEEFDYVPNRLGVYLGCGEVFQDFSQFSQLASSALAGGQMDIESFVQHAQQLLEKGEELNFEPGIAASYIASRFNAQGPNANYTCACVSSTVAIGESLEAIRRGDADMMLTGGSHSMIHPFGITGFHRLSTLSTRNDEPKQASRPFDRDRDGFVVGEGGVIFLVEELEHAKRRGADIWCELSGYGTAHDAFRITDPQPNGRSATRCMSLALQDARINTDDIDYVSAHGSSTMANDRIETLSVKGALGAHAKRIPMSSVKSMTGHLTTACGALDLLVCALAIRTKVVPPTINNDTPDPECDLDYVPNVAREVTCRHVLNNNFGFGGQNVSLVLSELAS